VCVDCLYANLPYNISELEHDQTEITEDKVKSLLNQFSVVGNSEKRIVVFHLHPSQYNMLVSCLSATGYQTIETIFWYKKNHNYVGDVQKWIKAVEMMLVAFNPKQASFVLNLDRNPTLRHNLFVVDLPVKKQRHSSDGTRVNVFEKPSELSRRILSTILTPLSNVLVVCMGSGSEVIGALDANMRVTGIEQDAKQVAFAKARVQKHLHPKKSKSKKKEASSEDEVPESSQQEEEADDQQVDQELEETGFVGGSDKGETKANCFTCKRELDVEEDAVVVCQHCNRYLCKPINASSSSSSFIYSCKQNTFYFYNL